ncbi:hypothetical protein [Methanosarcina sp.]|uniref:hypothetical protein n=1 Tax=Methanosarcina sp. TaxID=2213 RepID=UPI002ABC8194|nr:hypothetical protein [Methanosarcina sp.]MDY9926309.1 hypothetical protein [Methanosarcina sp.]
MFWDEFMKIKYYNIHDIFKVIIINNTNCNFFEMLNYEFSYFEVDFVENADMTINIGNFFPQNESCYVIDHKYHIKNNYLYCQDSAGKLKWETEINGFEYGKITININSLEKQTIFNLCLPLYTFLLEGMLMYSLSNLGFHIIHAASISKDNKAVLLAGRGGSFKTSLVMDLVRELDYKYMSDDKIILHKNSAYSFPICIDKFNFMLNNMENENYKNKLEKYTMLKSLLLEKDKIVKTKKYNFIENISSIEKLVFISKNKTSKVKLKKISDSEEIIKKLIENNRLELCLNGSHLPSLTKMRTNPFYRYMLEYSYVYPQSGIAKYWENLTENLTQILNFNEVYEIQMPYKYDIKYLEELKKYISI